MLLPDIEIFATAVSLSMDAFSVSICMGISQGGLSSRQAATIGGAFGIFQFIMPLTGAVAAGSLLGYLDSWASWIAAAMIAWVGVGMVRESFHTGQSCNCAMSLNLRNLATLAVATSLDALAVGFSIRSVGGSALELAFWSGAVTFLISFLGASAGYRLGGPIGSRAELTGGIVLCCIAANILYRSF